MGYVRSESLKLPGLSAPLLSFVFPLLGFKLFSGFLRQRLLAALLSLTSGGPLSHEGMGWIWWVGGDRQCLATGPGQDWEERAGHPYWTPVGGGRGHRLSGLWPEAGDPGVAHCWQ